MNEPTPEQQALIQLAKVLSNLTRLRMLQYLERSTYAMCTSFTRMCGVPQPQASHNLKKMLECGIVHKEKVGKTWVYSLNLEVWKVVQELWSLSSNSV
jgi:DNA-binding transcriptional ArsR family regulator